MPAVMKRSEQRLGHPQKPANELDNDITKGEDPFAVVIPPPSALWEPMAKGWYVSLTMSGQSQYYTNGDWCLAYLAAEVLDYWLKHRALIAMLREFNAMSTRLLVAEGDRRKAHIELQMTGKRHSDPDDEAARREVNSWRQRLNIPAPTWEP